jgi:hypothetical protein
MFAKNKTISRQACVAGELLAAEPVGPRWAISGEIVELSR